MKHLKYSFFLLVGLLLVIISCKEKSKNIIKVDEVTFKKEGELSIFRAANDSLLTKLDIEIAESSYETETGLMYRKSMKNNRGMLFISKTVRMQNFYMKNTEFALDLIFIKADSTIGSFQENAQPFDEGSLPSTVPVKYVLEVNAGLSEKWQLDVGDKVEFHRN